MLAQERYEYILDLLKVKKTIQVKNLSMELKVTNETIRRDLEFLEKEGQLTRIHGGAASVKFDTMQDAFGYRMLHNMTQKEEIARIAIKQVSEGQSISLDYSTTCLALAKELKKHFKKLTIITNSFEIVGVLSEMNTYNIIFCGGEYNFNERSCFGEAAKEAVKNLNIDIAFIGCGGVSLQEGCTETFYAGVEMLKSFINAAQRRIILVDSSKFDIVTLIKICNVSDIDLFITDSTIKKKVLDKYLNGNVEIINQ